MLVLLECKRGLNTGALSVHLPLSLKELVSLGFAMENIGNSGVGSIGKSIFASEALFHDFHAGISELFTV